MTSIADATGHLPKHLYRADQVRAMDRYAIDTLGVPGYVLMVNAGEAAYQLIRKTWPTGSHLGIVCGAGNNGGDGYVLAKKALDSAMDVRLFGLAPLEHLQGDALTAAESFVGAGGNVEEFTSGCLADCDIVVDGLLGTGLDRQVTGSYADVIHEINHFSGKVLALDIPSGLHANTGCPMGLAVLADKTISFIGLKQGLFTGEAADYCGEIHYSSLSVPDSASTHQKPSAILIRQEDIKFSQRKRCSHKGSFGHVLVIGGDFGYSGAIRLAGEAAARVGAGLVSIATRPEHAAATNLSRPELMCHGVTTKADVKRLLGKASVVAIGPGLGQSSWAKEILETAIGGAAPLVIDADALNLLAEFPQKCSRWVLTPHPGEAARLLECSVREVQSDRFKAIMELRNKFGGVCLLKGSGTLIAMEGSPIMVNPTGNPGMATGGMGDVLTGIIAGLIAQGFSLEDAAKTGAWLHGAAADEASLQGERGLLPSDLFTPLRRLVNP